MKTDRKGFYLFAVGFFLLTLGCTQKLSEKAISGEELILKESNSVGVHHADRAFDGSVQPDNFWESAKFPIWLQIEFKGNKSKKILKYSFQAGEVTWRMPKDWQFQVSNDGTTWKDLDVQKNQVDWKVNEERTYTVATLAAYKFYRLYFISGNKPDDALRIYEIKLFE